MQWSPSLPISRLGVAGVLPVGCLRAASVQVHVHTGYVPVYWRLPFRVYYPQTSRDPPGEPRCGDLPFMDLGHATVTEPRPLYMRLLPHNLQHDEHDNYRTIMQFSTRTACELVYYSDFCQYPYYTQATSGNCWVGNCHWRNGSSLPTTLVTKRFQSLMWGSVAASVDIGSSTDRSSSTTLITSSSILITSAE